MQLIIIPVLWTWFITYWNLYLFVCRTFLHILYQLHWVPINFSMKPTKLASIAVFSLTSRHLSAPSVYPTAFTCDDLSNTDISNTDLKAEFRQQAGIFTEMQLVFVNLPSVKLASSSVSVLVSKFNISNLPVVWDKWILKGRFRRHLVEHISRIILVANVVFLVSPIGVIRVTFLVSVMCTVSRWPSLPPRVCVPLAAASS